MHDEPLVEAAGQIADGRFVDWPSMTSTLSSEADRAIADELAILARIAESHRALHQLLPAAAGRADEPTLDRSSWGHLELLNVVGRGSYGTVYRAWDTRLQRLVALKLFPRAPDPEAVMREGRMLARVRHEHVVTVHGADVIDGVAGIWMEFVHGKTLDQIVKDSGPLPAREAAAICRDVARALVAIHAAHLLHCDVKAQNVVREASGRVVLMDMGAGRMLLDAEEADQQVAGTPRYMPPELFQMGATPTRGTDVYSLGVLLYYLTSGRYPVDGASVAALKQAHVERRATSLGEVRAGLPPALTALVARALDPDPSRRPASAEDLQRALAPIAAPAVDGARRAWTWAAAAAAIVAAALVWLQIARPSPTPPGQVTSTRRIAVLPIKNLTGDPSKAYIAEGLTDVLISNLARIRSLRVPSFAVVAPLRDSDDPPGAMAKTLGVDLLLAGSVTQADSYFRMTVQLIDPATGLAMWGDEIAREAPGMMSAQADIARFVAGRLELELSEAENQALQQRPVDPRAQDVYLQALAIRGADPTERREYERLFREATEIDGTFAAAWADRALVEVPLAIETANADRPQRIALARQMAERALRLDPALHGGYTALGTIQFYHDWEFAAAEQTFRQALVVGPSAGFPRIRLSMLLASRNRLDEAVGLAEEAARMEPLVASSATSLSVVYYYARKYDEAEAEARRALMLQPDFPVANFALGRIAAARGRHGEAIGFVERALASNNYLPWLVELARIATAAGRPADARRILSEVSARQREGQALSPDYLGYIAVAEGRFDEAFRLLNLAADERVVNVLWLAVDPRVDPLRGDPRFTQLLARLGL